MDLHATLDDLEPVGWSDPDVPTPMVQRIRALGRIPLREFTAEDLRLIISQKRGLSTLLPLALDLLEKEPFTSGDFYDGDLLLSVIRAVPPPNPRLRRIVAAAIARLDELEEVDRDGVEAELRAAYEQI